MVYIIILSIVSEIVIVFFRCNNGKKLSRTEKKKIVLDTLEQALLIFFGAVFALWITNISDNNKTKNQVVQVLKASEDELEGFIYAVSGGVAFGDNAFIGQLYTAVNYPRELDLRKIMFNESIFIHLDPTVAANISRFEANYERDFSQLKSLLDEPDGTTGNFSNDDLINSYVSYLVSDARGLIRLINEEICILENRKYDKNNTLYDPQLVPVEIQEHCEMINKYLADQ